MLTNEQLRLRRSGLGATDIVKLSGVSPYGGPCDVYASKIREDDDEPTMAMSIGNALEPVALMLLADARSLKLTPGITERHSIMTWALATPDANVVENGARVAVAEAKAVGFRMAHQWTEESVPDYVHIQVAWQMYVTGTKRAYVTALLGTEHRIYEVEHDDELAWTLLDVGETFWRKHVMARVPPPPDGTEGARRMVQAAWPKAKCGELVAATATAEELSRKYREARFEEKRWADEKERAQQALCALIGDNAGIVGADWSAKWTYQAETPVAGFVRKATRVFRLTEKKAKGEAA